MDFARLLVSPIVGSIIGYFTNWLAIKMLFRPHREIRFFNLKLPFTPGIIPKEKERIAKSVGNATGKYILSEEVIIKSLLNEEVIEGINKIITDTYNDIFHKDKTLNDFLNYVLEDNKEENIEFLNKKVSSFIIAYLSREENLDFVTKYITDFIQDKLDTNIEDINFKEFIKIDFIKDDSFKQWVLNQITACRKYLSNDEISLSNIIPDIFVETAMDFVRSQATEWMPLILKIMDQTAIENKIKIYYKNLFKNLGKFTLIFVDIDKLYNKIRNYLKDYIQEEENQKEILKQINIFINQILEKPISQWLDKIDFINDENELEKRYDNIIFYLNNTEKIDILKEKIKDYIVNQEERNLLKIIKAFKIDVIYEIEKRIKRYLTYLINKEDFIELIKSLVNKELERLFSTPVNKFIENMGNSVEMHIKNFVLKLYKEFVIKQSPYFIKQLDISDIVENRIIEFDTDEMEEIILSVVDRELKVITWLGGLLGFIIGFVPVLFG